MKLMKYEEFRIKVIFSGKETKYKETKMLKEMHKIS